MFSLLAAETFRAPPPDVPWLSSEPTYATSCQSAASGSEKACIALPGTPCRMVRKTAQSLLPWLSSRPNSAGPRGVPLPSLE